MWKVLEMVDKATNLVMNYTETESKVRDATNDDPWGPSGQQMGEIASFTFTYEQVSQTGIAIVHSQVGVRWHNSPAAGWLLLSLMKLGYGTDAPLAIVICIGKKALSFAAVALL